MTKNIVSVFILEDDPSFLMVCKEWLKRDKLHSYDVISSNTGADALEKCQAQCFDCILVDYRLPDTTGDEFINSLRMYLVGDTPPVIMMTAEGGEDVAMKAIKSGVQDYIPKGDVTPQGLIRAINNAVVKGRMQAAILKQQQMLLLKNKELERKTNEMQRFYHTVSHEMRTPLAAAREFVSLMHDGILGSTTVEQDKVLKRTLACCDQITTQFNDLTDLARLETGKLSLTYDEVEVLDLVENAVLMVESLAKHKSISIECVGVTEPSMVIADGGRIAQVVTNLLHNAIKFTPNNGKIRVAVRSLPSGRISIRVLDSGVGIDSMHLDRIFDRLYQIGREDSRHTSDSGLGLGLSIAREIVQAHGNKLRVHSKPGFGSCFGFSLETSPTVSVEPVAA